MALIFKLPPEFQHAHGDMLRAFDWLRCQRMNLSETLSGIPELASVVLEAVSRGENIVIRSATPGSMLRVRNYSNSLRKTQ